MEYQAHHRRAIDRLVDEFNSRRTQNDLFINRTDLCDYDGGYVDGKPAELLPHINALLEEPNAENANTLFQSVKTFRDWGVSDIEAYTGFMTEVEWAWMDGMAPMEDW